MQWGTTKDYMIWILGAIVSLWEIIKSLKNEKSALKISIFTLGLIVFVWLGIDQINRIDRDKKRNDNRFSALQTSFDSVIKQGSIKHASDSEFQKSLLEEYKIARDSATNKPKQVNYNTKIDKARDVYIGDKN
jgi:hypothetical protein